MNSESHRAEKILQRINELASISEDEGCITRTYGTQAFIKGRDKVEQWMKEAGLQTRYRQYRQCKRPVIIKE